MVPDRERGGADQDGSGRADEAEAPVGREVPEDVMDHQEPHPVRQRAHQHREEVDADRAREPERDRRISQVRAITTKRGISGGMGMPRM